MCERMASACSGFIHDWHGDASSATDATTEASGGIVPGAAISGVAGTVASAASASASNAAITASACAAVVKGRLMWETRHDMLCGTTGTWYVVESLLD